MSPVCYLWPDGAEPDGQGRDRGVRSTLGTGDTGAATTHGGKLRLGSATGEGTGCGVRLGPSTGGGTVTRGSGDGRTYTGGGTSGRLRTVGAGSAIGGKVRPMTGDGRVTPPRCVTTGGRGAGTLGDG